MTLVPAIVSAVALVLLLNGLTFLAARHYGCTPQATDRLVSILNSSIVIVASAVTIAVVSSLG